MFKLVATLVFIVAIGAGLLVGALNADRVPLDLLWIQLEWPLGLLLLMALAFGILAGTLLSYVLQVLPLRMQARRARRSAEEIKGPTTAPPASPPDD